MRFIKKNGKIIPVSSPKNTKVPKGTGNFGNKLIKTKTQKSLSADGKMKKSSYAKS